MHNQKPKFIANTKSIKSYCRRRRASYYSRLHRPSPSTIVLGSTTTSDVVSASNLRRVWRIPRRIRFLRWIGSPKHWLARLRDAYVRMMLRLASSAPLGYGHCGADVAFGPQRQKEYDQKILVEIYKQLLSQGVIVTADAGVDGRHIALIKR